ncbi:BnaC03g65430D [Brassica napus]|uniref:BnaC03g65430D protein n=1 Tax=Brassica napus TaxID=3708 RepID=A0A078FSQ0_BRANA|nr:BnaC03g65430D [Brassica napus]
MYQGSYSPGFLFGHQTQKTTSPFPRFLSFDEAFTSRYGSTSTNYHPKTTRSKPRRQKESEFQVNSNKKPTLTSSSSHESVEDNKRKGKDIGIIEFSMASLLDNLSKLPESPDQKDQQPLSSQQSSSSRQIAKISHYSDTSSSDYETESNEGSLPRQFAIGEGSSTPKKEPNSNEIPSKQFSSKIMGFTFDDIPFEKRNDRLDEFHAWMNSEAITSPLQIEFIGTPTHQKEQLQEEFFSAKCCSLRKKDLAKQFERQTGRYYALNGLNNPSLKHLSKICSRRDLSIKCSKSKKFVRVAHERDDLILGLDSYYAFKKTFDISIEPCGLRWKNHFKAFTTIPRLFAIEGLVSQEFTKIKEELTETSCADSHTEFLQKCNNSLWLNSEFFKMMTNNPPQWTNRQTEAVRSLKIEVHKLPPLKIPSTGTRIL